MTSAPQKDDHAPKPPAPSNRLKWCALIAMLSLYFLAYFQRAGIPGTIFDELQRDFRITASAVTGLGAMFVYMYSAMQLVAGLAADRFGGRKTLLFGSLFMGVGSLWFPTADSLAGLYASRILIGFGSSFVYLSIIKEIDTLFEARHFPGLVGFILLASFLGSIAATLPFERAANAFGWRPTMMVVGGFTMATVALAAAIMTRLPATTGVHLRGIPFNLLRDVIRNPRSRPLLMVNLVNFPVVFVMQSMLGKKFLQDVSGLGSAGAAAFVLVMALTCGVAGLAGGSLLRLTGQRRKPLLIAAPLLILLSAGIMLVGVQYGAPGWLFLAAYLLLALSMGASPAAIATMKELNRPDAVAVAISVLNGVSYLGVGILGNIGGGLLDLFHADAQVTGTGTVYPPMAYMTLFGVLIAMAIVSLVVTVYRIPETRGRPVTLDELERELP